MNPGLFYFCAYLHVILFIFKQTSKIIAAGGNATAPYSGDGQQASKGLGKSNVIRAVIDKLWYPITVEVLYKVSVLFSMKTQTISDNPPYGKRWRLVHLPIILSARKP